MDPVSYIEKYELKVGDWVQAPDSLDINTNLTPNRVYEVTFIPVGSFNLFYIFDDQEQELACIIGLPCEHLNGLLWHKYKLNN